MFAFSVYCAVIVAASLLGGWIPLRIRMTHRSMETILSFVAGVILGISLLHLFPHALLDLSSFEVGYGVLLGLLSMFFIERFFCFHHHDLPDAAQTTHEHAHSHDSGLRHDHAYTPHAHDAPRGDGLLRSAHHLRWGGAAVGLALHTLIEGVALAASMAPRKDLPHQPWLAGLGMFLVIVLHKPFDALTLSTLMSRGGWRLGWQHSVNLLFALIVPLGGAAFALAGLRPAQSQVVGWALAFSCGAFLCISLSDLLPELQFHQHDRWKLSLALLAGVLLAAAVALAESMLHGRGGWRG
ncbi:MAG: ZIP family metal transporter [Planctomycetia bacterium]|nr:ZIP family metal transporter [Planctomycetia bacterium]